MALCFGERERDRERERESERNSDRKSHLLTRRLTWSMYTEQREYPADTVNLLPLLLNLTEVFFPLNDPVACPRARGSTRPRADWPARPRPWNQAATRILADHELCAKLASTNQSATGAYFYEWFDFIDFFFTFSAKICFAQVRGTEISWQLSLAQRRL